MIFTKDDLKDGMVCTMRDGDIYAYLGGSFSSVRNGLNEAEKV
jgi:hypothetical protein